MRLIQTNLREIDVLSDPDEFVSSLKPFSANVLLLNVGGIVANYPTELDFQYRNPLLVNDFVGEILERVHANGMRLIARFDFSRLNEAIALKHPEWLYKSVKGETINYNGQVHTAFNGWYQQEGSIQIMTEAVKKYPIDGVFINMHGYVTHDYSYNHYGICQSDSDQARFQQLFGHPQLPLTADSLDPVYRDYEKFKQQTVAELFRRRAQAVKAVNPNVAICNYTPEGTDIFRMESNTGIDRQLPEFNYSASHHVNMVMNSWEHMAVSNSAVHFVDFAMRHSAVSAHHTCARLAQDLIHGGWLDFYVIGTLNNQDDRLCMESVKELYGFHRDNERHYTNIASLSDVCLIFPQNSSYYGSIKEFQGLFRILSEQHILFDVIHDSILEDPSTLDKLSAYQAVLLPDARNLSGTACSVLDSYVQSGGKLLATGGSSICDEKGTPFHEYRLASLGVDRIEQTYPRQQGAYFRVKPEDKERLQGFEDLDIMYLYDEFFQAHCKAQSTSFLGYIPPCMFGPPEKCYYTVITDTPGLIHHSYGKGSTALIPWTIGKHYEKLSNHAHSKLVLSALIDLLQVERRLLINTYPTVEVTSHLKKEDGSTLIHLVNLSGQLGTAFHPPMPIQSIEIELAVERKPSSIYTLKSKQLLDFAVSSEQSVIFKLPELQLFETIVIEY
ncbi:family 10 glycosylhydrolase [Paenibacillus sp. WQ 127069]|uniref:Family 10 glycosylhydrolase n=1 Tax=Paenibacillus baimaensis TaxID=2982185 RepID=A0ABT2UPH9_9BACL|nr:alpha-amylase family protein [Paenibacillus sp. WQ 127069]MCU6796548.1 family 10 glycosylhydrolase [Paenibacillus sp. WQ 127069]